MVGFPGKVVRGSLPNIIDRTVINPGVKFGRELTAFSTVTVDLETDNIIFLNSSATGIFGYISFTFRFTDRDGTIPDIVDASVESQSGVNFGAQFGFTADEVSLNANPQLVFSPKIPSPSTPTSRRSRRPTRSARSPRIAARG
jgi:hypothetical protein